VGDHADIDSLRLPFDKNTAGCFGVPGNTEFPGQPVSGTCRDNSQAGRSAHDCGGYFIDGSVTSHRNHQRALLGDCLAGQTRPIPGPLGKENVVGGTAPCQNSGNDRPDLGNPAVGPGNWVNYEADLFHKEVTDERKPGFCIDPDPKGRIRMPVP